jgi:hypothetical protein
MKVFLIQNRIKMLIIFICISFFYHNIELLIAQISNEFQLTKKPLNFIANLRKIFNLIYQKSFITKTIKGFCIKIKGKMQAKKRTRVIYIRKGIISLHKLNQNLIYSFSKVNHFFGSLGVKMWLIT